MTCPPEISDDSVALALRLAHRASEVLTAPPPPGFETKDDGSPVTALDRAVEAALRTEINAAAPTHGIVGEEYGPENADRDWVWILDPIDGTRQFAAGLPNFGTLIALCHRGTPMIGVISHPWTGMTCIGVAGQGTQINGQPVQTATQSAPADIIACLSDPDAFDSATEAGYLAIRAASRWNVYDGGCLGYAALASGHIGLALNGPNLEPFDIAALIPVIEGAGGVISDWRGGALDASSHGAIVASANPSLHRAVLQILDTAPIA
jgi:histidinol phosphatase-like enzyme (inositol monophosphatase family)